MLNKLKNIDVFTKNIAVVFLGTASLSFLNLLYQLLIAHKLSPVDFAAFNSLIAFYMLISLPLLNLQTAVAKYAAEYLAHDQAEKIKSFLSTLFKRLFIAAGATFLIFLFVSGYLVESLKISSDYSGFILALMLGSAWLAPVFLGGLQGLEYFGWFSFQSAVFGILKLILAFLLIVMGFRIGGVLAAFLAAYFLSLFISYLPLKGFISFKAPEAGINFKGFLSYLVPVIISTFCFTVLVNFDMVLVKYFFLPEESGVYSLAQMVGKIFLFLPSAISLVMFPRASSLRAKNMDTTGTLKKSLLYAAGLSLLAVAVYNIFPAAVLKVLTGKALYESIALGRLFSVSMTFFTLSFIMINYLLSTEDFRFVKYLVILCIAQNLAIILFHNSLFQVQYSLCAVSLVLFGALFYLSRKKTI